MTISYNHLVFTSEGIGTFLKLLLKWKGSIYKLVWRELIIYMIFYTGNIDAYCIRLKIPQILAKALKAAVLKLGVGTLLRVATYFIEVAKELLSGQFTLDLL
jgi:hypothetical protein